ncbi:actin [Helicosporidium sp. ATCC 50920]|nr:actin [Helicosporidium sp. ATCC 50920]|eukprot:KDD77031.1 actin [Helicosporidium sp. ATCC 50920]
MTIDKVAVIDQGSGGIRAGLAGQDFPTLAIPCVVQEAQDDPQQTWYPVGTGMVRDWEALSIMWQPLWSQLSVRPKEAGLMLTDAPVASPAGRKGFLELALETAGFERVAIQPQPVLALYGLGLLKGLVLDVGHGVSVATPVMDGCVFTHNTRVLEFGGQAVTKHLMQLANKRGYALSWNVHGQALTRAKEQLCYVALDHAAETKLARETTVGVTSYVLPDGESIRLGSERFEAPEVLFRPQNAGLECLTGLGGLVDSAIGACDMDLRRSMYASIILSGRKLKIKVDDAPRRMHLVFQGAAALGEIMKDQREFWVTKQEWEEDPYRAGAKVGGIT